MEEKTVHKIFKTITILKGIYGLFEILFGFMFLILSEEFISLSIASIIQWKFLGNTDSPIIHYISQFGVEYSLSIKLFLSLYFISHGIINLTLAYGILKKPHIAYPLSLVVLIGFLIYQVYSYFVSYSYWMLLFIIFEVIFIGLLIYEYNLRIKRLSLK